MLSIIVPNYNGRELLENNLPSLVIEAQRCSKPAEIIIADDASNDDSIDFVRRCFPNVKIIHSDINRGFGPTCNMGAAAAKGDVLAFVMSDLNILPSYFEPLLETLSNSGIFAVGSSLLNRSNPEFDGGVASMQFIRGLVHLDFPGKKKSGLDVFEQFFVCGGAMMVHRSQFIELGGFDDMYSPYYWEDVDLCYRAWKRGWRTVLDTRSAGYHEHPHSTVDSSAERLEIDSTYERNRFIFTLSNIHQASIGLSHVAWLPAHLMMAGAKENPAFVRGFVECIRMKRTLQARRNKLSIEAVLPDKAIWSRMGRSSGVRGPESGVGNT